MIEISETPFVPPGTQAVHTKEKFETNNTISAPDAASYTFQVNQPEKLRSRFLETPALFEKKLPSGSVVRTLWPSGSYSPAAVLITAIRPEIVNNSPINTVDGRIPTKLIYDLPNDAHEEYFRQILASYQAVNSEYGEYANENYSVLFTENASSTVSNEKYRVARTIAEPHAQVWVVGDSSEPFDSSQTPRLLRHERSIFRLATRNLEDGITRLINDLTHELKQNIAVSIRLAPPYGYVISTHISQDYTLNHQAQILTHLMKTHHQRYSEESNRLALELNNSTHQYLASKILPQPSYKVFGKFNSSGLLELSIAPTFLAGSGVVEALDRQIYRDPENLPFFESLLKEEWYYKAVSEKIQNSSKS